VVLLANTRAGGINAVECTVLGLFSTVSKAYDDSALQMPIATARELLRVSGSHVWVLLLEKTEDTQAVLASLRSSLADRPLEFVPWSDLADFYNKTVVLFRKRCSASRSG